MTRPGDLLLSPWALASVGVLLLNDHVLKGVYGNVLTGKLSDVAGVFVFPFLMLSILEISTRSIVGRAAIVWSIAVTGAGFAAVKLVPVVGDAYEYAIGVLRYVLAGFSGDLTPILVYRDVTDLWVLPVLAGSALVISRRRFRAPVSAPETGRISPAPRLR
ncbi:hypothetical protein ABH922_000139 [Rhodococcus sp. 27YEA15]|uniref:hypothetical protein n=1 Tax=Rhodococcus sp. 27YEA15 TaxID=3156259 RepID=UPI003C7C0183